MKKLILDTPFRDSFSDFLEKGETIVWQGQPSLTVKQSSSPDDQYSWYGLIFVAIPILFFIKQIPIIFIVAFFALMFFIKIVPFWIRINKRNFNYAITQKQIIFQFKKNWFGKNIFHAIPFSEIKDIIVVMKILPFPLKI